MHEKTNLLMNIFILCSNKCITHEYIYTYTERRAIYQPLTQDIL